ncbi:hypothetical protein ABZ470_00830 [Streptosporangium sp. NPDC020072]|uniref:hypothetical protein n=1 Tax=Streptosporangium sp. NPDC020072 TaxID=3154788 RepID=UPI00343C2251
MTHLLESLLTIAETATVNHALLERYKPPFAGLSLSTLVCRIDESAPTLKTLSSKNAF